MRTFLSALVVGVSLLSGCATHTVSVPPEQASTDVLLIDDEIKRLLIGQPTEPSLHQQLEQSEPFSLSMGTSLLGWLRQHEVPTSAFYDLSSEDRASLSRLPAGTLLKRIEEGGEAVGFAVMLDGQWLASHQAQAASALAPVSLVTNQPPVTLDRYDLPIMNGSLPATLQNSVLPSDLKESLEPVLARGFPESRFPQKGIMRLRVQSDATGDEVELASAVVSSNRGGSSQYIVRVAPEEGASPIYYDGHGRPLEAGWIGDPVDGEYRLTSKFDPQRRHPVTGRVRPHNGVDFAAPTGTPVVAASDGEVIHAGWQGSWGKLVVLSHDHGVQTRYAHLSSINGLSPGDRVGKGELLGKVGTTGLSTGPHLHFEVYQGGLPVDPQKFDPSEGIAGAAVAAAHVREHLEKYRAFEQASLSGLTEAPRYLAASTEILTGQGGPDDDQPLYSITPVIRHD